MASCHCCLIVSDTVLRSDDHHVVWAALAGPCRSCSFTSGRAHSAGRCCACWWTGLMLRAAVTAVRGMSFKPIHPLSGVYAAVIYTCFPKGCHASWWFKYTYCVHICSSFPKTDWMSTWCTQTWFLASLCDFRFHPIPDP